MANQTQAPRRERVVPRVRERRAYDSDPRASFLVHHRPLVRGLRSFAFALALLASVPIMQPIQFPCNIRPSGSLLWTADDKSSSPGKGRAVKLRGACLCLPVRSVPSFISIRPNLNDITGLLIECWVRFACGEGFEIQVVRLRSRVWLLTSVSTGYVTSSCWPYSFVYLHITNDLCSSF